MTLSSNATIECFYYWFSNYCNNNEYGASKCVYWMLTTQYKDSDMKPLKEQVSIPK